MNERQKIVVRFAVAAIVLTTACPPFHVVLEHGRTFGLGFALIFEPPHWQDRDYAAGTVDITLLLVEWAAIGAVAGLLYLLAEHASEKARPTTAEEKRRIEYLRSSAGFVGALVLAGIAAVTGYFVGRDALARYPAGSGGPQYSAPPSAKPAVTPEPSPPKTDWSNFAPAAGGAR